MLSLARPTTVHTLPLTFTLRPRGLCPRKKRMANAWLTIITGPLVRWSSALKSRPSSSGIRMVAKQSGDTRARFTLVDSPSAGVYPSTLTSL